MKQRRIHAEHLVGRTVHDINNCRVGRIEEIEAEETNSGCFVTGFVLGQKGLLKRLSIGGIGPLFIRSLQSRGNQHVRTVPWDKVDLSNPKRPKLRCGRDEI